MNNNIKLLQSYTNGNYIVKIYSDGTKIRITEEDKFIPEFPESIDMKITDYCEVGCPMCHENSSIKGKHANFNYKFLDTLKEGMEIACLSPDTIVYTNLGATEIKNIREGDFIFDSDHNLVEVVKIKKSLKKVIHLKGNKGINITCTHDHPIISSGKEVSAKDMINNTIDTIKKVDNITENSNYVLDLSGFVVSPEPSKLGSRGGKIENNYIKMCSNHPIIERYITVDKDLMWMYGITVAEGSRKSIVFNINEVNLANRFKNIYKDKFNLDCREYTDTNKNSLTLEVRNPKIYYSLFFKSMGIGYGARNKSLSFLYKIQDKEFIREALYGMFQGDGSFTKRKIKHKSYAFYLSYKTASKKLAYDMIFLLKKHFGIEASLFYGMNKERKIEGRILSASSYYKIEIHGKNNIISLFPDAFKGDSDFALVGNTKHSFKANNITPCMITEIIDKNEYMEVYDITLDENSSHVFPINGYLLTHNCGGGNALSHPNLKKILEKLNSKNIICNMTIHNSIKEFDLLISLLYKKLIHGLGISANNPKEFRNVENILNILIKNGISTDNIVLHVIEGIVNYKDLIEFKDILPDKLLILGNKLFGRGIEYNHKNGLWLNEKRKMLVNNIDQIFRTFKVVATDNLAIETLELRKRLDEYTFNSYYMGDEGEFTMYIDLVEGKYAKNSTTKKSERKDIKNNIIDMFKDL